MKRRFIKNQTKDRVMIRSRCCEDLCNLAAHCRTLGYEEVGLVGFLKHILFWWRKPKDIASKP